MILGHDGLLGRVHAAEAGAVRTADGAVAGTHALDEHDVLRFHAVGRTVNVAAGRTGGGHHAFVLKARDDVGIGAAAVFLVHGPVHEIIAGGRDDGAHLFFHDLIHHVVHDGAGGAHLGAHAALAFLDLAAVIGIDGGLLGNGLGEGNVDGTAVADVFIEGVGHVLRRTLFGAGAAAGALVPVDVGGALSDLHGEVAHEAGNAFHLGMGVQRDVRILGHVHHLGREHAARAVDGGEGLVELGHLAADGAFTLHHDHADAGIGRVEGGLNAGHTAADDEDAFGHVELLGVERRVATQLFHGKTHQFGGLVGVGFTVAADPGDVLADVGHFKHVAVETGALHRAAERGLVHARRAGSHHHAVEAVLLDGLDDVFLSGLGTGVHGVFSEDDIGIGQRDLGDGCGIHRRFDVAAAVTDEYADFHDAAPAAFMASRSAATRALRRSAILSRRG